MYYDEARPLLADAEIKAIAERLSKRLEQAAMDATPSLVALYAVLAADRSGGPDIRGRAIARMGELMAEIDEVFSTMDEIGAWLEAHVADESGR